MAKTKTEKPSRQRIEQCDRIIAALNRLSALIEMKQDATGLPADADWRTLNAARRALGQMRPA